MTSQDQKPDSADGSLDVRLPLQRRTREQWTRVLDAGVALLEDGGYEAFTIPAICKRAHVPPRALYARVNSKDALFLAVYEHAMDRLRAEQAVLSDRQRWHDLAPADLAEQAVRAVSGIYLRHAALLRAIVLISGVHPEVNRRGGRYLRELGDRFTTLLLQVTDDIDHPNPEAAIRGAFAVVFSALSIRVAYGPGFATSAEDDESFTATLTEMVRRFLFA